MIGLMDGVLLLLCVLGFGGMWLYFFIKEADEHTGWVRVAAFACRMAVVMMLAAAIMAFGGFWLRLGGEEAWSQIQIRTRGVEAFGEVLQTTSYQVMSGRRFHRQWTESYSTTLRLSPECGVETASINPKFRLYEGIQIEVFCVPGTGIVALNREIKWSPYLTLAVFAPVFCFGAWLFVVTLLRGWRPIFEKPKRRWVEGG